MLFMVDPVLVLQIFQESLSDFNNNLILEIVLLVLSLGHVVGLVVPVRELLQSLLQVVHFLFLEPAGGLEIVLLDDAVDLCL